MKRKIFHILVAAVFIAGIVILIRYLTRPKPVEVSVKPVEKGMVERTVSNTRAGTVKACRRAKLSPGIGGQISKLPIREGERVKKGELLLELWNEDLLAELKLAQNEVESSIARKNSVCVRAEMAKREAVRMADLIRRGAVSEERADKAATEAKALESECSAAESAVATSRSRVGAVRAGLERTRLIAPFDGIIAEINGELNEYVTPSPIGIATPPAIDLVDNSCFYVTAPIDEVDAADVRVGMPARISLDAFSNRRFDGKVVRIDAYVLDREKQARTVDVEVQFLKPADIRDLLPGYSADIEIILEQRMDILRIPTESILDGKRVFVFIPDRNRIEEKEVRAGISNWDFTEILSGLSAGEQIILNVDRPEIKPGIKAHLSSGLK
ncbi:MAG: efflux RND transporter periplasmic adaptor subunit [Thermodesulfobacteriota bacterium]